MDQHEAFEDAVREQWDEWLKFGAVRVLSREDSRRLRRTVRRNRILRSRFAYKDKNANVRAVKNPLPVRAKACLCIGGQNDPDAIAGILKTDAPTVLRTSIMVFS